MAKFRKKPKVIEAIQLKENNIKAVHQFMGDKVEIPDWQTEDRFWDYEKSVVKDGLTVHTLEGKYKAPIGWWIIKGIKGEFYPCEPEIFEETYEKVVDDDE